MGATPKREAQTRRDQAEHVVERLTDFGVRINSSSRIGRMLRILRRPGIIEPNDPDYPIVLESIRDMYQLRLIVDTMDAHTGEPVRASRQAPFLNRVSDLPTEVPIPEGPSENSLRHSTASEIPKSHRFRWEPCLVTPQARQRSFDSAENS